MKRSSIGFAIAVALAAIVGACDGRSPTSPNRLPPATEPVYSLSGIVTEPVDVPVEGATVTVVDGLHKGKSSVTDNAGYYALIGVAGSFTVQVSKDGYSSSSKVVTVPQTVALDVEITRLAINGNISGNWTVTFEPHVSCANPLDLETRKYRASIVQQGAQLSIALSGATFTTPPHLSGTIHDLSVSIDLPGGCDFYCYYGPTAPPAVIEDLGGTQFLGISGLITATVDRSGISGTLSGEFTLMRHATAPLDLVTWCRSSEHLVTFTR